MGAKLTLPPMKGMYFVMLLKNPDIVERGGLQWCGRYFVVVKSNQRGEDPWLVVQSGGWEVDRHAED
jgi:hypothetical protein